MRVLLLTQLLPQRCLTRLSRASCRPLGVYFDTLVVCSITAFIILLGPSIAYGEEAEGVSLTQAALASEVGNWGIHFVTFILFFLAFSSILGNYYLAEANVEYLTRSKVVLNIFRLVVLFFVWFGAVGSLPFVFALADTGAATMVFLNILAIVPLSGVAIKLLKNYNEQRRKGIDPSSTATCCRSSRTLSAGTALTQLPAAVRRTASACSTSTTWATTQLEGVLNGAHDCVCPRFGPGCGLPLVDAFARFGARPCLPCHQLG